MTLTFDGEQVFWWAAALGLTAVALCVLADTGLHVARLILDLERDRRARPRAGFKNREPNSGG